MSQSLARVLIHIVFSTRDRKPWLNDAIRLEMHAYLAAVASHGDSVSLRVGGTSDHVHVAMFLSRTEPVAKIVQRLKVSTSKWVKARAPEFEGFGWQKGYAVFSVGLRDRSALVKYIANQMAHHQRRDFQTEMRKMFSQYGVEFDERFVWN